jgi:hypothetical protein
MNSVAKTGLATPKQVETTARKGKAGKKRSQGQPTQPKKRKMVAKSKGK